MGQRQIAFVNSMCAFQGLMSSVCAPQNSMQLEEGTLSFEWKQTHPGLTWMTTESKWQ